MIHADHRVRPGFEPHRCSFTLRDADPDGFFEGRNLTGPADVAYISASRVTTYAQALGMVTAETHAELVEALDEELSRATALELELVALREKFDAIDVLESAGFTARRKAGRKPANRQEVTA